MKILFLKLSLLVFWLIKIFKLRNFSFFFFLFFVVRTCSLEFRLRGQRREVDQNTKKQRGNRNSKNFLFFYFFDFLNASISIEKVLLISLILTLFFQFPFFVISLSFTVIFEFLKFNANFSKVETLRN